MCSTTLAVVFVKSPTRPTVQLKYDYMNLLRNGVVSKTSHQSIQVYIKANTRKQTNKQ